MYTCFLIELGYLLICILVALNDISRQQVTLEILEGHSTLLPLLYLSDIKLELLHTVYL